MFRVLLLFSYFFNCSCLFFGGWGYGSVGDGRGLAGCLVSREALLLCRLTYH